MSGPVPSAYQTQKKTKPKIHAVAQQTLDEKQLESVMNFVNFVQALKMTPQWSSTNSWTVSYQNKRVCHIKISNSTAGPGSWYIRPALQYSQNLSEFCTMAHLEKIMLDNVHFCHACGRCAPGKTAEFWGQTLYGVCCSPIDFEFHNPDAPTLKCIKALIRYRRQEIADLH
jgi:hypothetical protein